MFKHALAVLGASLLVATVSLTGCSSSLGGSCDKEGSESQCSADLICGRNGGGTLECEQICRSPADCDRNSDCLAIAGSSTLACTPRYKTR